MITKYVEYNLICDDCEKVFDYHSTNGKRELRALGKMHGWLERKDDNMSPIDICPECGKSPKYDRVY